MDERGEIRRNLVNPPVKDTVVVPTSGLTVVRFLADNPGFWLVHCHMSMHNHIGMAFVIKVTTVTPQLVLSRFRLSRTMNQFILTFC